MLVEHNDKNNIFLISDTILSLLTVIEIQNDRICLQNESGTFFQPIGN